VSTTRKKSGRKKRRKATPTPPAAPARGPVKAAAPAAYDLDLLNFNFAAAATAATGGAAPHHLYRGGVNANPLKMPRPSSAGFFKQPPLTRLSRGVARGPAVTFGVAPMPVPSVLAAAAAPGAPGWVPAAPVPVSAPPAAALRGWHDDAVWGGAGEGDGEGDGAPLYSLPPHAGHGDGVVSGAGEGLGELRFGYGQWGRR